MTHWNPVVSIMTAAVCDSDNPVECVLHSLEVADHRIHRGASATIEIGVVCQLANASHVAGEVAKITVHRIQRRRAAGAFQEASDITLQIFYCVCHLSFWATA
ncbi:MAG: hypothetical protein AAF585_03320 [Verrucomicrobiota bacterium]